MEGEGHDGAKLASAGAERRFRSFNFDEEARMSILLWLLELVTDTELERAPTQKVPGANR
jgi:hypothetical protein